MSAYTFFSGSLSPPIDREQSSTAERGRLTGILVDSAEYKGDNAFTNGSNEKNDPRILPMMEKVS